ncbi:MAG: hypothetical protein IJR99_01665 [Kiritimatiellae bacterium]|nr:hypothetical protein [Kiritimatiellia bacterium]
MNEEKMLENGYCTRFHWHLFAAVLFPATMLYLFRILPMTRLPKVGVHAQFLLRMTGVILFAGCLALGACTSRLSAHIRRGICASVASWFIVTAGFALNIPYAIYFSIAAVLYASCEFALSAILPNEKRPRSLAEECAYRCLIAIVGGVVILVLFLLAMWTFPGGGYNPCTSMLSKLGRVSLKGVLYPTCYYFFTASLTFCAFVVFRVYPALVQFLVSPKVRKVALIFGTVNVAGLLTIAWVPEGTVGWVHNLGCQMAVSGGALIFLLLAFRRLNPEMSFAMRWGWVIAGFTIVGIFCVFLFCHSMKWLPFSPYVPTFQKLIIITFALYLNSYALYGLRRFRRER